MPTLLLSVLLLLGSDALPATPQLAADPDPGYRIQVGPWVGGFLPSSLLYRSDFPPARARMENSAFLGAGVQLAHGGDRPGLRLGFRSTLGGETLMKGEIPGADLPASAILEHTFSHRVLLLSLDLHQPLPWLALAGEQAVPYAFLGAGWKQYSFGDAEPPDQVGFTPPQGGSSGMIHYGLGLELEVGGQRVEPEVAGVFNRYVLIDEEAGASRSHPQHELLLGVRVPFTLVGGGR